MSTLANVIGYLWLFAVASIILAILVDISAERMRMRRRRIDLRRQREALDREFNQLTHPSHLAKNAIRVVR